jgi:methylenetetrahydrofolate reductase (NADPH)
MKNMQSLKDRMERMKTTVSPLFTDITWGAGGSTAGLSMDIAIHMQRTGHTANLHMTCTNIKDSADPVADIQKSLQMALDHGITNIVALRGDPPAGETEWKAAENGFACALDLVKFMRATFGDAFGISVAGYPEGHPNAISLVEDVATLSAAELARSSTDFEDGKVYTCLDADYQKEMEYLKAKVDAGAGALLAVLLLVHCFLSASSFV